MSEELQNLDESRQREIFQLLVELQDQGLDVRQSREKIAAQECITVEQVVEIEKAGLIHTWPPLD